LQQLLHWFRVASDRSAVRHPALDVARYMRGSIAFMLCRHLFVCGLAARVLGFSR
jgi:hypothetical protein